MRKSFFSRQFWTRILLVIAGLFIGVAIFELAAGFITPQKENAFCVWQPNQVRVSLIPEKGFPGLGTKAYLKINSQGFRADEYSKEYDCPIITIGGSTTECLTLDQDKTWPFLLQERLREKGCKVWVGNAGVSGHNTRDHIFQVKYLLKEHPNIKVVILLLGINDFLMRLERNERYNPHYLETKRHVKRQVRRAFAVFPSEFLSFPKNLLAYQLIKRIDFKKSASQKAPDPVHPFVQWRNHRNNAEIINKLPELKTGLHEYRANLLAIINELKANNVKAIFATQPTIWNKNMSPELKKLLWMGYKNKRGGDQYYSAEALQLGMEKYNEVLLDVCKEKGLFCLDLARLLPKDTTIFYDDCHFNEQGAQKVAHVMADHLAKVLSP